MNNHDIVREMLDHASREDRIANRIVLGSLALLGIAILAYCSVA